MGEGFFTQRVLPLIILPALLSSGSGILSAQEAHGLKYLSLPIIKVTARHAPYADFCSRTPRECQLTGPASIPLTGSSKALLEQVNTQVNSEILFALDTEQYDQEEYWSLPRSGWGDCEDLALEKRYRLARLGFPRAALRLAIVFHKTQLHSHALLTVETTRGTYVMDSFSDGITPWNQTPYNFESRERPGGRWEHFDQSYWTHEQ